MFSQTNIGTVLRTTLGRLLRDGCGAHIWAFPSATVPSWAESEKLKLKLRCMSVQMVSLIVVPRYFVNCVDSFNRLPVYFQTCKV